MKKDIRILLIVGTAFLVLILVQNLNKSSSLRFKYDMSETISKLPTKPEKIKDGALALNNGAQLYYASDDLKPFVNAYLSFTKENFSLQLEETMKNSRSKNIVFEIDSSNSKFHFQLYIDKLVFVSAIDSVNFAKALSVLMNLSAEKDGKLLFPRISYSE